MREILFRGKRVDNGEWVYGAYGNHTSFDAMIIDRPYLTGNSDLSALNFWMVNPATVGQYTGLTDKNGTKIFEGDILSERPSMNNEPYIGYVKYDEELTAYRIIFKDQSIVHILGSYSTSYTVIGNIHDNPELLK